MLQCVWEHHTAEEKCTSYNFRMCSDVYGIQYIIIPLNYKAPFLIESDSYVLIVSLVLVQDTSLFMRSSVTFSKIPVRSIWVEETKLADHICEKGFYCWRPTEPVEILIADTNAYAAMGSAPLQELVLQNILLNVRWCSVYSQFFSRVLRVSNLD